MLHVHVSVLLFPFSWGVVIKTSVKLEAGTKVGPDQLGPPVQVGSTWIQVHFYFILIFLFDPSRSELIRPGQAVQVDLV